MATLIVGGTSGLGLELAKQCMDAGQVVVVMGRHDPGLTDLGYEEFDLTQPDLPKRVRELTMRLPELDTVIYNAGYFQDGRITDLSEAEIEQMIDVGGRG